MDIEDISIGYFIIYESINDVEVEKAYTQTEDAAKDLYDTILENKDNHINTHYILRVYDLNKSTNIYIYDNQSDMC